MGENVYDWSTTALTNGSADSLINFAEGQLPSTVNNSARAVMAALARFLKDNNATLTTGGSANAYTLSVNGTYGVLATGLLVRFRASFANSGAATLNVTPSGGSALGAKALRKYVTGSADTALVSGNLIQNGLYTAIYDATANSAAGAWIVLNPIFLGSDITGAALTKTDDTNITLTLGGTPASALLQAASITVGWTGQLSLARGGTAANLTASTGGIVYSGASALAILSGTATARQMLQSGASAAPAWSTTTWPATTTVNRLLYSSSANVIGEITTGNDGVLITSGAGVPSISSTIPSATQDNITRTGTLVSGATGAGFTVALGTSTLTGDLPFSNLAQGSARSVAGVTGNGTADFASIQGAAGQLLAVPNAGTSLAFTATPQLGLSGTLGSLTFGNATSGLLTLQTVTGALGTVTVSLPAATDTLVGKATTDTFTNKTYDTAGTGNSFSINGVAATANTGTGAVARAAGPTFTTPALGVATATSINGNTFTTGTYTLTGVAAKTLTFNNSITLAGTDATTMTFPPASASIGYLGVPQNSKSAAYTTVLADAGKHIFHPSADTTARIFTIDSNANVAYAVGDVLTFVNQNSGGVITIAITTDTMRLAGAGTTGSRTLAANGIATAIKVATTEWLISGTGLT